MESTPTDLPVDLTCPITLELLEDPISTPCCGHAFSRASLGPHLANNSMCPICRARIKKKFPTFDVDTAPTNRNLAAMVEHYVLTKKAIESGQLNNLPKRLVLDDDPLWNCTVSPIKDQSSEELSLCQAQLSVNWPTYEGDVCMLIPVIDKSGSMSGRPFEQVKQALLHMHYLTFVNRHVFTCLIVYDSKAEKILVPRDGDLNTERAKAVEQRIKTMSAGGGTDFSSAFKMIQEVLLGTRDKSGNWTQGAPVTVTNAVVVFMTDGQDSTYHGKPGGNDTLVNLFQSNLKDWKKPLTVHTIGFSKDHDFNFLDRLRKSGSVEGVFRYAEPGDAEDSLCQKMSGLANSVVSNVALQAMLYTPFPLRGGAKPSEIVPHAAKSPYAFIVEEQERLVARENDANTSAASSTAPKPAACQLYRTELRFDMDDGHGKQSLFFDAKASEIANKDRSFIIEIGRRDFELKVEPAALVADSALGDQSFKSWCGYLAREILLETMGLAEVKEKTTEFYLKCCLLLRQGRVIDLHVRNDETLAKQLEMCMAQLEGLIRGKPAFSVARLSEVAKNVSTTASSTHSVPTATPTTTVTATPQVAPVQASASHSRSNVQVASPLKTHFQDGFMCDSIADSDRARQSALHKACANRPDVEIVLQLQDDATQCVAVDPHGHTPLHFLCYSGRRKMVETVFRANPEAQAQANNRGQFPLDVASLRGYWMTVEVLLDLGAPSNKDPEELVRHVLANRHYNTAARLIARGYGNFTNTELESILPVSNREWLLSQTAEKMFVAPKPNTNDTAIASTTATTTTNANAESKPATTQAISTAPTEDLATLLRNAVKGGMATLVPKLLEKATREHLTAELLFLCGPNGEKGADMAEMFLQRGLLPDEYDESLKPEFADASNFVTPLYRAAERGWDQLLIVLIENKANVNWQDKNGNTPLIAACTNRRLECIVELLNVGADLTLTNLQGDSALVAACQRNMCSGVSTLLASIATKASVDLEAVFARAVHQSCRQGHDVILEMILLSVQKHQGDQAVRSLLEGYSADGMTPLTVSAEQNKKDCIRALKKFPVLDLEHKTAPDSKTLPQSTALHVAVYYGSVEAAIALLESGANPNSQDSQQRTPLHTAVLQSHCFLARLLKSHKADLGARDKFGRQPSYYASAADIKFEMDDPLLQRLIALAQSGSVSASEAHVLRHYSRVCGVIRPEECVSVASGDSWSALMEAVVFANAPFAHLLLELGASLNARDSCGLSPLFWARLLNRDLALFFGAQASTCELSQDEAATLVAIEDMKKADVRNALLFEINLNNLYDEVKAFNKKSSTANALGFLNNAMAHRKEQATARDATEIPKTRSKCSLASFIFSSVSEDKFGVLPGANTMLVESMRTIAKYLAQRVPKGQHSSELGLQELVALHLLSSYDSIFASLAAAGAQSQTNATTDATSTVNTANNLLAPFSLCLKVLTSLPVYNGEIYRGYSAKFEPKSFEVGTPLTWNALTMCTSSWFEIMNSTSGGAESTFKYNIIFIIKSSSEKPIARSLADFSSQPNSCPVVLLPNTSFVVKSLHVASIFGLSQPEVRESKANQMTEDYLKRAATKFEPIFIVLE